MTVRSSVRALPHPGWSASRNWAENPTAPLLERDEEFARLAELLAAADRGSGTVAVISGAVGIGKSVLLHAVAERAAESGGLVLGTTGVLAERTVPLGVIGELFHSVELPQAAAERAAELLEEGARHAAELAGAGCATNEPVRRRVLHGLWTVLRELTSDGPLLLTVDDVHHADTASLQCLLYVVRRLRTSRILMVLAESEHSHGVNPLFRTELLREPRCERIQLGRLSAHAVARLAGEQLGDDAVAELAAFSGGNPLLVRALLADQRASRSGQHPWRSRTGLFVGDAFGQAVMSCVQRVEPTMLAAVRGLALLGETASSASLGSLLGVDTRSAARAIHGLHEAGLLADGWFRHPAATVAVLDGMSGEERRDGHRRVARLLHDDGAAATVIAPHLIAADHTGDDWVLSVLQDTAEQARQADDIGFAVECLELATRACSNEVQRAAVTMHLARTQWRVNPAAAARHLAPLTKALLDGHLPAGDATTLVKSLLWHGRVEPAAEVLAHMAFAEAEPGPASEAGPGLSAGTGSGPAVGAGLPAVDQWLRSLWPQLRPPRPAPTGQDGPVAFSQAMQAATLLTDTLARGADGDTVARAEQLLRTCRLDDDSLDSIESALLALVYADRPDKAALWCTPMLERACARGASTWQARLSAVQAEIALRHGDAPAAERWARAALTHIPARSWGVAIGAPMASLALAMIAMGRTDEAAGQLDQPVPPAMAQTRYGLLHRYARGQCRLATNQLHAALTDFLACGDQMCKWDVDLPALAPWRGGAAVAYLRMGEQEQAARLAGEQLTRPGAGRLRTHGMSLRVLAAASELKHRPRLLWKAAEAMHACGDRLELAGTLADLSRAHAALGEAARSRALGQQALQLAEECQAEPLIRAILRQRGPWVRELPGGAGPSGPARSGADRSGPDRSEAGPSKTTRSGAAPSGAAPSGAAQSGVGPSGAGASSAAGTCGGGGTAALSDAERRVASLVALGHTNREVAQALFLTISTVEQHLTRIYRKLDVSGRSDLSVCLELDLANPGATLGVPLSPLGAESTGDDGAILASMECGSGRLFPSGDSGGTRTICP